MEKKAGDLFAGALYSFRKPLDFQRKNPGNDPLKRVKEI
jgi:hypothetical protein